MPVARPRRNVGVGRRPEDLGFVYILKSKRNGRFYIGSTNNVERRYSQHCEGMVYSTKRLLPIELVFQQEFSDINTARRVERRLKSFKRHDIIERIIADGKIDFWAHSSVVEQVTHN